MKMNDEMRNEMEKWGKLTATPHSALIKQSLFGEGEKQPNADSVDQKIFISIN